MVALLDLGLLHPRRHPIPRIPGVDVGLLAQADIDRHKVTETAPPS
jgi:hypothetical protein